jgi:hypothetical protein
VYGGVERVERRGDRQSERTNVVCMGVGRRSRFSRFQFRWEVRELDETYRTTRGHRARTDSPSGTHEQWLEELVHLGYERVWTVLPAELITSRIPGHLLYMSARRQWILPNFSRF